MHHSPVHVQQVCKDGKTCEDSWGPMRYLCGVQCLRIAILGVGKPQAFTTSCGTSETLLIITTDETDPPDKS